MFRIYHILGLLQNPPSMFDDLKQQIHQDRQINQRQRYMLFEIERLVALRTRSQVPQEMETKMSEFEARLAQYQQLRVNFMTEIAHNNGIAFMFLNALSIMKNNMLTNYSMHYRKVSKLSRCNSSLCTISFNCMPESSCLLKVDHDSR